MTNGECHNDIEQPGCMAKFHIANVYLAQIMIIIDGALFGAFCYKWYKVMEIFRISETDHKIPKKVLHSFYIQFTLTIIAMGSCSFDGVMHLILHDEGQNYHTTMMFFLFDCTVVATCNFSMISESQAVIRKFICFCCTTKQIRKTSSTSNEASRRKAPSIAYLSKDSNNPLPDNLSMNSTHSSDSNPTSNQRIIHIRPFRKDTHSPPDHPLSDHDQEHMSMPQLCISPTNSAAVRKENEGELDMIREEIDECVRKGSIVIDENPKLENIASRSNGSDITVLNIGYDS